MAEIVTIALGSNLGDREAMLAGAIQRMAGHPQIQVTAVSKWIETPAMGMVDGAPPFLNGIALLSTDLSPLDLLSHLESIEREMGRHSKGEWQSRTIDLDIIFFGSHCYQDPILQIPHPHYHLRSFVLEPLLQLMPHATDPISGKRLSSLPAMRWSIDYHLDQLDLVGLSIFELIDRPAIVAVRGEMGVGKTTLIRSIVSHCGVLATSPTFDIIRSYPNATIPCLHIDLYRIQSAMAFDALDISAYLPASQLVFIEWPDHAYGGIAFHYELGLSETDSGHRSLVLHKPLFE